MCIMFFSKSFSEVKPPTINMFSDVKAKELNLAFWTWLSFFYQFTVFHSFTPPSCPHE